MNSWPKISLVTPSFNQGQFIEQTIESVLNQDYPNLEYVIIDGGSTDDSVSIISKYQKHLKYWVSEPDKGQSDAINKGLKYCSGDVFNWLNSDDYYTPGALKIVGEQFKKPTTKVFAGKSNLFGVGSISRISRGTNVYPNNLAKTIGWARIDQPETFFRLANIQTLCGINQDFNYLMDRDLWIRYLLEFGLEGVVQSENILVNFRLHQNSKTVSEGSLFNQERNNYFYSLALNSGFKTEANLITIVTNSKFTENIPVIENQYFALKIINYYLLLLAEEYYQLGKTEKVNILVKEIDYSLLDQTDVKLFQKIKFRNQYLPLWLISLLRKT